MPTHSIDKIISRIGVLLDWLKTVPVSKHIKTDLPLLYEYQRKHQEEKKMKAKAKAQAARKSFQLLSDDDE